MHEVLVNHFGGLGLPRKSMVRLADRPDMTIDVYPGRKTTQRNVGLLNGKKKHLSKLCFIENSEIRGQTV